MVTEDEAMRRAIALAARGLGTTSPNPVVGCVLLDADGEVVGEGFHAYAGGPHAEIVALAQAGERARGGTAVVTLEPCNHTGRTGPCAAGADQRRGRRGWSIAVRRPDAGRGRRRGHAARRRGRRWRPGYAAQEARGGQRRLADRGAPGPAVRDLEVRRDPGRAVGGRRRHQPVDHLGAARTDVHGLRGTVDAIIAGVGTVLADDPQLTVRDLRDGTAGDQAAAAGGGRLAPGVPRRRPGSATRAAPTWIATAAEVGAGPDGRVDLPALLAELYARGVRAALLEGGPTLAGAFLAAGLVDQVVGYVAPKLLGAGPAGLLGAGVTTIAEAIDLDLTDITQIGPDLRFTAVA